MIIDLPDTTTRSIAEGLVTMRETSAQTTGRVLTLIVVAEASDDLNRIVGAVTDASQEHPARVLVLVTEKDTDGARIDAQLRIGGDAGASEIVIMHLHGRIAEHPEAVVTPLLLPDTPIVAWWPEQAPRIPAEHPIGRIAQRRITDSPKHPENAPSPLPARRAYYEPGDTDMMWARITAWRGLVASALEIRPHEPIHRVRIYGPATHPSVDIAAGWLAARLGVEVIRDDAHCVTPGAFMISRLVLERESGNVELVVVDKHTIKVCVPGFPDSLVALSRRSIADCLAEELRHLDPDRAYTAALEGLDRVTCLSSHSALPQGETMPRHDVTRVPVCDRAELTATAARRLADLIVQIQSSEEGGAHGDGIARIVLTGGGAGIGLLRDLRSEIDRIDPQRIHLFFGDERNVPVDDPESNEGQARSALLDEWGLPEEAVHGYGLTGGDMGVAVEKYRRDLELFAPLGFDVHLLGMGGEGHINSLFPHSAALTEEHELVLPVTDSPKPPAERVTLTMEAVKQADRVWLLVSGEEKAEAAAQVLRGSDPLTWPAAGVQGRVETLLFLAEDAAGGGSHA